MNYTKKAIEENIGFSGESCSTTEEFDEYISEDGNQIENYVREEVQMWLANHGRNLFSLETSKFIAKEKNSKKKKK